MSASIVEIRDGDVILVGYNSPNAVDHDMIVAQVASLGIRVERGIQLISVRSEQLGVVVLRKAES